MPDTVDIDLRLKGNYYAQPNFFSTDITKGVTRTPTKARVCALTSDFLLGFRDAVIFECGKSYRRVMKSVGKRWGKQFVQRFDREISAHYGTPLGDLPTGVVHTCLTEAFAAHGWGRLRLDLSRADSGVIEVELRNSVIPSLVAESDRPVDLLVTGMLGSVFGHLAGRPLDAVQTDCPTQGAEACRFLVAAEPAIAEVEAWLAKATPHAAVPHENTLKRLLAITDPAPVEETP